MADTFDCIPWLDGGFKIWFYTKDSGEDDILHCKNTGIGYQWLVVDNFGVFWRNFIFGLKKVLLVDLEDSSPDLEYRDHRNTPDKCLQ